MSTVSDAVSAILLAAGQSRRMGEFKQLLPFAGKTFVECCVDHLLAARARDVIVVTGHREAEVRAAIGDRPVTFAHNAEYRFGMSSSIKRGVEALPEDAGAILVALADQPQIGVDTIDRIIAAYESQHPLIVIPTYKGGNGHPILLDASLRQEILGMDQTQGLRQVVHAHRDRTLRVEAPSEDVLVDFDYPEDYQSRES